MNSLMIALLFIAAATAENTYCNPGSTFKMDCNTCTCSDDGKTAACTDMLCPDGNNEGMIKTSETKQVCEPGSTYSIDNCNTCKCSDDGTRAFCTMIMCPANELDNAAEPKQICKPRSQFSDYCNTCTCADDGLSFACTMMMCDKEVYNQDGTLKISQPLDTVEGPASKQVCKPLSQFKNYCNTCFCSDDGLSYSCTRMMCDSEIWNEDGSLKIVAKSKRVARSAPKKVCQPGTQFKNYCNTCGCADDGSYYSCTRMMCDKDIWNKDGTLKAPVNTFKSSNSDKVCEPGKEYSPDGCNICICNKYGTESACTYKLCLPTFKQAFEVEDTKEWGPVYQQGDACTPGKSFYSECNRCVCLGNGKSAFCTLMTCPVTA